MQIFTVTLYAGPTLTVTAPTPDAAFTQAQVIARTTATGIVRDASGHLV